MVYKHHSSHLVALLLVEALAIEIRATGALLDEEHSLKSSVKFKASAGSH